jgi:predicted NUDIX family NTP pyrophosphohydrolase
MYRIAEGGTDVLLVHPGGPFFAQKDEGSWTIPKGLVDEGESDLEAAKREFEEETSFRVRAGSFIPLGEIRQKGGKIVVAFAFEGECEPSTLCSNSFELEWPPRSGQTRVFPEIDRAEWFQFDTARTKMIEAQRPFLDRLRAALGRIG